MEIHIQLDDIELFCERQGEGPPLLLLPGLGSGTWVWQPIRDALAENFELIMPELRGSGRSSQPDMPYSIALFARDMRNLLNHLALPRVYLLGLSMGGFVALHLAAKEPSRVASLVLVSTSLGGQCQIGPDGRILSRIIRPRGRNRTERIEDAYQLNFSRDFLREHREQIEAITRWRLTYPQQEFAYYRQLLAGNAYDGTADALCIRVRTLICAGSDDPLVPPENAEALRRVIPRANVRLFPGKHLFFFERPRAFAELLTDFLLRRKQQQRQQEATLTGSELL